MIKIKKNKLYRIICKFINLNKKYNISYLSAAISFYMIVSLISLFIILLQIINVKSMDNTLVLKLLSIFSDNFSNLLSEYVNGFKVKNHYFFIITLLWSASSVVNLYNKVADNIYEEIKRRNSFFIRISSLLMFLMILVIIIFEMIFIIFSNRFIIDLFNINNKNIIKIVEGSIELISIFFLIIITYTYLPPVKMNFKKSFLGSIIISFMIYLFMQIYLLVIYLYKKINIVLTLNFIISSSLIFIFLINYLLILGIIINYYSDGRFTKNKFKNMINNINEYKEE